MQTFLDISYAEHEETKLDIYTPDSDTFPVFIYFHGGGLEHGDKKSTVEFAPYLTARGVAVVSANYRMYPTAKYPDFVEDAAAAVSWVKAHISEYGSCTGIFVGGSSAGGFLSMMLCFDGSYLGKHGIDPLSISGFIHDAGQPTCHFNVLRERGIDSRRVIVDESAPLFHVGLAPAYAPMHFIVSDNDMAGRYEQTMTMLATFRNFRYDMDKITHSVMHGTHCAYVHQKDENGDGMFGRLVYPFIKKISG